MVLHLTSHGIFHDWFTFLGLKEASLLIVEEMLPHKKRLTKNDVNKMKTASIQKTKKAEIRSHAAAMNENIFIHNILQSCLNMNKKCFIRCFAKTGIPYYIKQYP